jgi:hypothetical protein
LPDIFIKRNIPAEGKPAVESRFLETRGKRRATGQCDRQNEEEKKLFESFIAHQIPCSAIVIGCTIREAVNIINDWFFKVLML